MAHFRPLFYLFLSLPSLAAPPLRRRNRNPRLPSAHGSPCPTLLAAHLRAGLTPNSVVSNAVTHTYTTQIAFNGALMHPDKPASTATTRSSPRGSPARSVPRPRSFFYEAGAALHIPSRPEETRPGLSVCRGFLMPRGPPKIASTCRRGPLVVVDAAFLVYPPLVPSSTSSPSTCGRGLLAGA